MRKAQQHALTFTALDSTTGARVTGLTFSAGEIKLTKSGGALANPTNAATEIGIGIYAITLTAAEMNTDFVHFVVNKTGVKPVDLSGFTTGETVGAVVSGSATTFVTDLTASSDDFWRYTGVEFRSGALAGQIRQIASYNGTTKAITLVAALTAAPTAGDLFVLIS